MPKEKEDAQETQFNRETKVAMEKYRRGEDPAGIPLGKELELVQAFSDLPAVPLRNEFYWAFKSWLTLCQAEQPDASTAKPLVGWGFSFVLVRKQLDYASGDQERFKVHAVALFELSQLLYDAGEFGREIFNKLCEYKKGLDVISSLIKTLHQRGYFKEPARLTKVLESALLYPNPEVLSRAVEFYLPEEAPDMALGQRVLNALILSDYDMIRAQVDFFGGLKARGIAIRTTEEDLTLAVHIHRDPWRQFRELLVDDRTYDEFIAYLRFIKPFCDRHHSGRGDMTVLINRIANHPWPLCLLPSFQLLQRRHASAFAYSYVASITDINTSDSVLKPLEKLSARGMLTDERLGMLAKACALVSTEKVSSALCQLAESRHALGGIDALLNCLTLLANECYRFAQVKWLRRNASRGERIEFDGYEVEADCCLFLSRVGVYASFNDRINAFLSLRTNGGQLLAAAKASLKIKPLIARILLLAREAPDVLPLLSNCLKVLVMKGLATSTRIEQLSHVPVEKIKELNSLLFIISADREVNADTPHVKQCDQMLLKCSQRRNAAASLVRIRRRADRASWHEHVAAQEELTAKTSSSSASLPGSSRGSS